MPALSGLAGCPRTSVKERTVTSPRDIRYGDDPIVAGQNKTRYRRRKPDVHEGYLHRERSAGAARRRTTTRRLRDPDGSATSVMRGFVR